MSDEEGKWATPLEVVESLETVLEIIRQEGVGRLVMGIPLNMDGTIGPSAKAANEFARELARQSGIEVLLVDERLSSFAAEESLVLRKRAGEKMTRKQKKSRLDAHAAASFLREFLEGKIKAVGSVLPTGEANRD